MPDYESNPSQALSDHRDSRPRSVDGCIGFSKPLENHESAYGKLVHVQLESDNRSSELSHCRLHGNRWLHCGLCDRWWRDRSLLVLLRHIRCRNLHGRLRRRGAQGPPWLVSQLKISSRWRRRMSCTIKRWRIISLRLQLTTSQERGTTMTPSKQLLIGGSVLFAVVTVAWVKALSPPRAAAAAKVPATAVRLSGHELTLPGDRKSFHKNSFSGTSTDTNGTHFTTTEITPDLVTLDSGYIDSILESGTPTDTSIPTDCRMMIRWKAADSSVDMWTDPSVTSPGGSCIGVGTMARQDFSDFESGLPPNWVSGKAAFAHLPPVAGVHEYASAGPGTVRIEKGGNLTISASDQASPDSFSVYVSRSQSGDVFFWVDSN